jgi:hypothetical protein
MRPSHLLLGLVVILGSGAAAFVATRIASTEAVPQPEAIHTEGAGEAAVGDAGSTQRSRATEDKVAMLTARLDMLTEELESLRNSALREPAAAPTLPVPGSAPGNAVVTPEQRQAVLAVLAEEKAREAAEAEAKRAQAEKENAQRRAARIAKELNLSPGDETRLADLMFENGKKRQEVFESMRTGGFDRDTARTQFETFRTWQTEQLTQAFGASIADQIIQSEGDRFFGGGPGGFAGGPGGGGAGNAGATQGGRGRRRDGAQSAPPAGGGAQQN